MGENYNFIAYRYFLVADEQGSLFPKMRDEIISEFYQLFEQVKTSVILEERKYILYSKKYLSPYILVSKFAKETHFTKNDEGEVDLTPEGEIDFPYVYLIIDFKNQIILIQRRSSVFRTMKAVKTSLESFVTKSLDLRNYVFSLDEISNKQKFWEIVNTAEGIYFLELELRSPNFLGAKYSATEFLKKQREIHNSTEVAVKLENKHGKLKVLKEHFESYIDYIAAGAGKYKLKYKSKGQMWIKNSNQNAKTLNIIGLPEDQTLEYVENSLKEIDELGNKE